MAQKKSGWNPMTWFGGGTARKVDHRRTLALEALESREVPATIVVTNLLDSTNPTVPLTGSLREAVTRLAVSGDEIRFADSLFPEGEGPKTLVLNGAVGALQVNVNNISIIGPGRFTTGNNDYKLILESDIGFATVKTTTAGFSGGINYKVGDYLDQGSTQFTGGARFQVQAIGLTGNITQVSVVNPGANSLFTGTLSSTGTGSSFLTKIGNSVGSGAIFVSPSKGLASNIVFSQLIDSAPRNLTISGIHFGDAKSVSIEQNLGSLIVNNCLFDNSASSFISSAGGSGSLTISNSAFDGASVQVAYGGSGPLTINTSTFTGASALGAGLAISGGGSALVINSSAFHDGENGVKTSASSATITNTYFTSIPNGALTLNGTNTKITNGYFADNERPGGIYINPSSYSSGKNANRGGAAIFAYGGANLDISKSLFLRNVVDGIQTYNCGGGAIFNYSGTLKIDQSGFTENSVAITGYPLLDPPDNATDFVENPEMMPSAANSGGGALYSGGSTTITNSYFNKNSLTSSVDYWTYTKMPDNPPPPDSKPQYSGGGAMYLTSNNAQTVTTVVSNTTVTENTVTQVSPIPNPYVGAVVVSIASADFDQDGAGDLAVASALDTLNIQIRTGSGFGTFATTPEFILSGGGAITSMTTSDFNGDGFPDLAVANNTTTNNLAIFMNKGLVGGVWGGFNNPVNYTFGRSTRAIVSGDMNGDGIADLVLGNRTTTGNIVFGLNNGKGIFTPTSYSVGTNTNCVAIGDLNNDGKLDILAGLNATTKNAVTLYNQGAGKFNAGPVITIGAAALTAVGIGKFYNAGSPLEFADIAATNAGTADNFYIFDGTDGVAFTEKQKTTIGSLANGLVVANLDNLNGDDVAISQLNDADNTQIGLSDAAGVVTFATYTAGTKPSCITPVKFLTTSNTINLGLGDYSITSNIQVGRNNGFGGFSFNTGGKVGVTSQGAGLNGGAMIIAAGVDPAQPNATQERAFTGTTNAQLINVSITNNTFTNPFLLTGKVVLDSNARTVGYSGGSWANLTDTGGVFNNTGSGSSITVLNSILNRNIGLSYVGPLGFTGIASVEYSNTGSRFAAGSPGSFSSVGHNLYNDDYGFSGPASGDLTGSDSAPIFDVYGLQDNLGPVIGLTTAQPVTTLPDQGQGNVLTIALDRLSPCRDSGDNSVYTSGLLPTDARGVKRLINLAVDMGAYEVQFATQTTIVNPTLNPAVPPAYVNPYLTATYGVPLTITAKTQWNDNKIPNALISGTVSLVNADNQSIVYATGILVPISTTDLRAGALATLTVNTNNLNLLPSGKNNYIALYSGDPSYAISQTNTFTIDVGAQATTTTLNLGNPDVQAPSTDVEFTGQVNYAPSTQIPTGSVTLEKSVAGSGTWSTLASTIPLDATGAFSAVTQFTALGDYDVRAVYTTDNATHFNSSTSNSVLEQIGYIPTVTLTPFPAPAQRGDDVTFTAVVNYAVASGVPTGTVSFVTSDGTLIGTVTPPAPSPAGTLTYTVTLDPLMLPLGENSIIAQYNRNGGNYVSETSKDEPLVITGVQTTTTLSAVPTTGIYGSPVVFTATITPTGGPAYAGGFLEFYAGATLLQSLPVPLDSNGWPVPVSYTTYGLNAGTLSVTALYTGDTANYLGSTSNAVEVTINPATTTLSLDGKPVRIEVGHPITLTASLTNSAQEPTAQPGGAVTFYANGLPIGTPVNLSNNTAVLEYTPTQTGTIHFEARYPGNLNYTASSATTEAAAFQAVNQPFYMVAPQQGSIIQMFDRFTNEQRTVIQPFGPGYTAGFTVARGDINNDGTIDFIYAARVGGQVQAFDGLTFNPLGSCFPFGPGFSLPLSLAVGDINGDGFGDIVAAPGATGMPPHVVAISGGDFTTTLFSRYAYAEQFLGGVSVGVGEVNGDGFKDIVTSPLLGAAPHIVTFNGLTGAVMQSYYAYSPIYVGGVSLAVDDLDGDGYCEIITGAMAAAPHVVVVDSRTQSVKASFYAYDPQFGGGVRVTTIQDINNDGINDIITGPGPGAGPNIVRFDGAKALRGIPAVIDSFFAYGMGDPSINYLGGVNVG